MIHATNGPKSDIGLPVNSTRSNKVGSESLQSRSKEQAREGKGRGEEGGGWDVLTFVTTARFLRARRSAEHNDDLFPSEGDGNDRYRPTKG
eukprot:scaffold3821_cov127-Cylindrotheca_fusiformis.AAC.3